jgi:hypothetical protein
MVMPLAKEYKVDFDKSLVSEVKDGEPEVKLFLHEKGEYLVFQPIFSTTRVLIRRQKTRTS